MADRAAFTGDQPAAYDEHLAPSVFAPYAEHAAMIVASSGATRVLELAAGTGAGTRALAALPDLAEIVATDLSADMLARAAARLDDPRVTFAEVDAQRLPYADGSFDAVMFLFGVMFVPDRAAAYQEIDRVLRPGGCLVMTSWDARGTSTIHEPVDAAVRHVFPQDPPTTDRWTPNSYHDVDLIRAEVAAAGFVEVDVQRVGLVGRATAEQLAEGYGRGSALAADARERGVDPDDLVAALRESLTARFGSGAFDVAMSAVVTVARRLG